MPEFSSTVLPASSPYFNQHLCTIYRKLFHFSNQDYNWSICQLWQLTKWTSCECGPQSPIAFQKITTFALTENKVTYGQYSQVPPVHIPFIFVPTRNTQSVALQSETLQLSNPLPKLCNLSLHNTHKTTRTIQ